MKAYFLNIPNEERQSILDKHKNVYDGYVTNFAKPSEQPLYVQDFANDKDGITVNNKGEVKRYTNIGINENLEEMEFQDEIGDGPMDFGAGVFDEEITEDESGIDLKKKPYEVDVEFIDEGLDQEDNEKVKENVKESLDWFKRFSKYN